MGGVSTAACNSRSGKRFNSWRRLKRYWNSAQYRRDVFRGYAVRPFELRVLGLVNDTHAAFTKLDRIL